MARLLPLLLAFMIACRDNHSDANAVSNITLTRVTFHWDSTYYLFEYCKASIDNDRLKVYLRQLSKFPGYDLDIIKKGKEFEVTISQSWSVTDSSYVPARFKVLKQNIKLNRTSFRVNDQLKGELDLLVLAHKAYSRNRGEMKLREDWDTVRVSGVMKTIVQ